LMGSQDLVALEFPPYDETVFQCLLDPDCADPKPSAFFDNPVFTAVSTQFAQQAPALTAFLARVKVSTPLVNKALAYMEQTTGEPDAVAQWFLQHEGEVWTQWVPRDVAVRVQAALPPL